MKLSVIIVSYNTKKLTLNAIKSVFADTSVKEKEVIVVDNGSSDGSVKSIAKHQNNHKKLKLIVNDENKGFSIANNQGIRTSIGEYILLLNSDTSVKKGALVKMVSYAEKHPEVGIVGARLLKGDGSLQSSCFNFPTLARAVSQYWLGKGKPLDKFAPKTKAPVGVDVVVGAAMLITPQAIKKIGSLDQRYFFFYEDLAYCREVKKAGLKVYYLPDAEIIHYHGASGEKLANTDDQWRRLIPSSKIYHGLLRHYIFSFILWSGQKIRK